jgi:hypothetical protein
MFEVWAATLENTPTPLSHFLASLPGSWEMQIFYGLMLSGSCGMFAHYALKWARNEIKGSLFCYFSNNFRSTCLSFFTFIGIAVAAIASGAFVTEHGAFIGWKMVFWMGLTNGFTIDAIVNKTSRAQWSNREREVKTSGMRDERTTRREP